MLAYYETPRRASKTKTKQIMARLALAGGLLLLAAGAFAAQVGIGGQRLPNHTHSAYGDGGLLPGVNVNGPLLVNTNNVGNIVVSTGLAGSIFLWSPSRSNLTAGLFTTSEGAYRVNLGSYTFNLGAENKAQAHYSGILGYGNYITGWRYNSFILGSYMNVTASNAFAIGNGDNLYRSVNASTNTIKIFNVNIDPIMTFSSYTAVGIGTTTPRADLLLDVAGNLRASSFYGDGGNLTFSTPIVKGSYTSPTSAIADYTFTNTTYVGNTCVPGSTITITTTGGPLVVFFNGSTNNTMLGALTRLSFKLDGSAYLGTNSASAPGEPAISYPVNASWLRITLPLAAGSHTLCLDALVTGGTGGVYGAGYAVLSQFGAWELR